MVGAQETQEDLHKEETHVCDVVESKCNPQVSVTVITGDLNVIKGDNSEEGDLEKDNGSNSTNNTQQNSKEDCSTGSSLKHSSSVPSFLAVPVRGEWNRYGSETHLSGDLVPENSISMAKSYNSSIKGSETNQSGGRGAAPSFSRPSSTAPHKVQFAEEECVRRTYIDSTEDLPTMNKQTNNISPLKVQGLGGLIKGGSPGRRKGRRMRQISEASTLSASSVASDTSGVYSYAAPDGGYGWVVVAASFLVNMIADGVGFSFGVMFDEFEDEFGSTKAVTGGVVAVFHAVPLLTGPLATWLTDRYGCRKVTIMGAIFASSGFLLAAFSHHIALLYLFFGAIAGFGLSLCYVAAIIIVAYYFDRRRSFATGISVCGSGVGTFVFAPFTQYLLDRFDGWRGACIILAGIFLNMCFCGMLFRELPWTRKLKKRRESSRSLSDMPEIDELRLALEEGDVSAYLDSDEEEPKVASSLITIPTYIKNSSKLPPDVINLLANNKQTYHYILHNFPDSLIAKSISDYALEKGSGDMYKKDLESRGERKEESAKVKLARRVSSLLKIPKSILKKDEAEWEEGLVTGGGQTMDKPCNDEVLKSRRINQLLRMRRQSLTCRNRISVEMRSSSCPDIMKTVIPESPQESGFQLFKYCSVPFLIFCLSNCILYFWYDISYVYTIEFAESILKVPPQRSTHIISIIGILNTFGEVVIGWIGDQSWASSPCLYAVCMLCCAVSTALMPLVRTFPELLGLSAVYGFCISANYSLTSPILVDLVSIERFSSAYGFLLASQGIANLLGPPFAGWLYDYTKEWYLTFGLAGLFIGISGVLLVIIPAVKLVTRTCQKKSLEKQGGQGEEESWGPESKWRTNGCVESAVLV